MTVTKLDIVELGDLVLREKATEVENVFDDKIQTLIDQMLVTVKESQGVGLAAPQVGVSKRLFIISPEGQQRYPHCTIEDTLIVINPKITLLDSELEEEWEGCLSIPGIRGRVTRPSKIDIHYINRLGELKHEQFNGFTSRIFQHENDHLDGILFLDRMDDPLNIITDKEYFKLFEDEDSTDQTQKTD